MSPPRRPTDARLQRETALLLDDSNDLLEQLTQFENEDEARTIERLAEADIVLTLQLQRYDPATPEWLTFARALAEYGYAVFVAWGATGTLRRMAARHGGGRGVLGLDKLPERLILDGGQAHALAAELITHSVETFRATLAEPKRTWRPDGGASIRTYFIGRCLMDLPDVYRQWWRREGPMIRTDLTDFTDLAEDRLLIDNDPAHRVTDRSVIDQHLKDPLTREMFELQARGYSLAEIAEMVSDSWGRSVTEPAVRTRMSRARPTQR